MKKTSHHLEELHFGTGLVINEDCWPRGRPYCKEEIMQMAAPDLHQLYGLGRIAVFNCLLLQWAVIVCQLN